MKTYFLKLFFGIPKIQQFIKLREREGEREREGGREREFCVFV
jgi:hypothetical protein